MCPGASDTFAYGIGGGNARGLLAVIPEPATLSLQPLACCWRAE